MKGGGPRAPQAAISARLCRSPGQTPSGPSLQESHTRCLSSEDDSRREPDGPGASSAGDPAAPTRHPGRRARGAARRERARCSAVCRHPARGRRASRVGAGRYGGYRLARKARLPPVLFTHDEVLGLVMAVLEGHPAATDPADPVGSALAKVIRVTPRDRRPAGLGSARARGDSTRSPAGAS